MWIILKCQIRRFPQSAARANNLRLLTSLPPYTEDSRFLGCAECKAGWVSAFRRNPPPLYLIVKESWKNSYAKAVQHVPCGPHTALEEVFATVDHVNSFSIEYNKHQKLFVSSVCVK